MAGNGHFQLMPEMMPEMMPEIILIASLPWTYFHRSLGVYQLATRLRADSFNVQVIDCATHWKHEEWRALIQRFVSSSTLAVGISSTFYGRGEFYGPELSLPLPVKSETLFQLMQWTSEINPQVEWVVGGANAQMAQSALHGVFDRVFVGYSDQQFVDYARELKGKGRTGVSRRVYDYDPRGEGFDFQNSENHFHESDRILPREASMTELSRGCIFRCKFCDFPLNGKMKNDFIKDASRLRDELTRNYENYGITKYYLSDDTHNDSMEKLDRLHTVVRDLPFRFQYATYLRLDLLHRQPEAPAQLVDMGLVGAFFGIESFHKKAAHMVGKGALQPQQVKDFLCHLKRNIWRERVKVTLSFIVGLPHEPRSSIEETTRWLTENQDVYDETQFYPLCVPKRGLTTGIQSSEMASKPEKFGLLYSNANNPWHWTTTFPDTLKDFEEARLLTQEVNLALEPHQGIGAFTLIPLSSLDPSLRRNTGKSWEEIMALPKADFIEFRRQNWIDVSGELQQQIREYFTALMQHETKGARF